MRYNFSITRLAEIIIGSHYEDSNFSPGWRI